MLTGVKFIPREKMGDALDDSEASLKNKKSGGREERHRKKKKTTNDSSSDYEDDKIRRRSRRKNWYSSDEHSSSYSSENESCDSSDQDKKKRYIRKKSNRSNSGSSRDDDDDRSKKRSRSFKNEEKEYSSSTSGDEGNSRNKRHRRRSKKERMRQSQNGVVGDDMSDGGTGLRSDKEIIRKEMGLEWMLRPEDKTERSPAVTVDNMQEEAPTSEINEVNPRELNPYLKDNGSGYPEDADGDKAGGREQLPSSSVVGDGGASWRLKALKRAQEQAAREGRRLDEIVEERWGSLGKLTVSAASHTAAPSRAHLHAIKNRKRGLTEEHQAGAENQSERDTKKHSGRDYLKDVSSRHPKMREPKVHDSLSWGKRRSKDASKDASLISAAASSLNKFADDGSFMHKLLSQRSADFSHPVKEHLESKLGLSETSKYEQGDPVIKDAVSANQLAAKALQLKMKGRHDEAERLLQEAEYIKATAGAEGNPSGQQNEGRTSRYILPDLSTRKKEDDADMNLAQKIMQNKQYSMSGRADDEYDFDDGPSRKSRKKKGNDDHKSTVKNVLPKRILTQQERCSFCFENPNRPKHLIVSIANFTYLMLPQRQPVVPGHCCILPMQHDSATRTVDKNVWEEIRNFKKCLIMMFAKQEKDVVFLETVMGLAQQRRHCMIECIPLPQEIAKEAPLYFKKAIDEAEDEWSQHNAKKLIDTSVKGLRGSIPEHFPYFHVEFGLNKGFVHVIDDEKEFKTSLGLNVIRGMLRLPEEDMYRRRRSESVEVQKQAVASFYQDWEPFDWTNQL